MVSRGYLTREVPPDSKQHLVAASCPFCDLCLSQQGRSVLEVVQAALHSSPPLDASGAQGGEFFITLLFLLDAERSCQGCCLQPKPCLQKFSRGWVCLWFSLLQRKTHSHFLTVHHTSAGAAGPQLGFALCFFQAVERDWFPDLATSVVCPKWNRSLSSCLDTNWGDGTRRQGSAWAQEFPIQEADLRFAALLLCSVFTHTHWPLSGVHHGKRQQFKGPAQILLHNDLHSFSKCVGRLKRAKVFIRPELQL